MFCCTPKCPIYYSFPSPSWSASAPDAASFLSPLFVSLQTLAGAFSFAVLLAWIAAFICQILIITETLKINFLQGAVLVHLLCL